MRIPSDRQFYLLLIFLALLPAAHSYTCIQAVDNGHTDGYTWMSCYQQNGGAVAGYSHGSLSNTWFGQSGSWTYNYNDLSYYHATNRARSWNCYYHNTGTCQVGTSCCCGCSRDCYNYRYIYSPHWAYFYDWRSNYYCDDSKTVAIYRPCHYLCSSCDATFNQNSCDSCLHTSYGKGYKWLNWGDTSYRKCDTYCPNRNYDNAYKGQYIANIGDTTCSWCNPTCSKCQDLNGGGYCRTCVNWAYLLASYSLCVSTFPADSADCHPDYYCLSSCPNNLYFQLPQFQTTNPTYDWAALNSDSNVRQTNVCYLCHRYCLTCTNKQDSSCTSCASSFYKWQQGFYGNRCGYYCNQGNYTSGGLVGQYIDPVFGADPHRRCALCDSGCKYCAGTASTCYICQDDHFLLDDMLNCTNRFTCQQCQASGAGGIVTDGCPTRNNYCRASSCPTYFYFKVYRTGSGDLSSTNAKYNFFTQEKTMNYGNNGYANSGDPRYLNTSLPSPFSNVNTFYRKLTNFCKLCDFRCMLCTGPTNFECTLCVNNYYKWTNDTVCESYCPVGQFQQNISTSYPNNQTTCANCDVKCISCEGYNNNCSACTIFPNSNYAFLYSYVIYNATCMTTCPSSSNPLTEKGFYGSIGSMTCYACPGGCSNCNIDYVRTYYTILQSIVCGGDYYCSSGIVCTSCLSGYSLVGGSCVDQTTCRLYSYYVQGNSSTTWSPSNCRCLDGYYFSSGTSCSLCHMDCLTCNGPTSTDCLTCHEGYIISSGSCANDQVRRKDQYLITGSTVSNDGYLYTDYINYQWCGSYYTLFGYRSGFTTSRQIYYSSPSISNPNYYAISVKARILFIDQWQSTAGIYFRLGSTSAYPFYVYNYNIKGAIGQMQCGTSANDYLLTINAKTNVSPTGTQSWSVYMNAIKNPVQNSTGFYYYWGLHDAVFTVLQCHSSCSTCSGPLSTDCKSCTDGMKEVVNGECLCRTSSNYYYAYGAVATDSCMGGCPTCTYSAGNPSSSCYYRDTTTRMCVNPPIVNCSAPYLYGQPYELTNSYGTCRQNCSSGYYAIQSLMKCTTNCAQFSLYYYRGASSGGAKMDKCVSTCPSGLIADPSTMWCVTRCPTNWYYKLQNRTSNPLCTNNCTTGYEYDNMNQCVVDCPSGYYYQVVSTHNKCVQTCSNSFGDNVTLDCVLFCPTPSFADPVVHLCVKECTNSRYEQISISNGNRTCVTVCQANQWLHPYYLNCSRDPMDCPAGFFADNHTHKCEQTCTTLGEVGQNTTRLCQTACNTGYAYWAAKMCVSLCPSSPAMFSFVSGSTRICVSSCNSSSTDLFGDQQANRSCVATCSASPLATYGNYGTNLCVQRCPVTNQYGDPNHSNRHCVTHCSTSPAQTYAYTVTKLCVATCPQGYFGDNYTTPGLGICNTGCPSPYYGDVTTMLCVSRCTFRYFGTQTGSRICTMVCPSGWFGINSTSNRICVTTCDNNYWADNFTRMCYNTKTSCSNNTYADKQLRYCVNGTDCTTGTYADPKTMGCQSACTNSSYFGDPSTNLCVMLCPSIPDYYSQSGYCTASCTGGQFADWQAYRSCVVTCTSSPVSLYGTTAYRCVTAEQCWSSFSTYGNNNTRLCSLCSGSLPFGDPVSRQCVSDCPLTYYGDTTTNLCVLTCDFTRFEYADNATGKCTTLCTLGTFGVNSTTKPICQLECPVNTYALDSSRTCVANCGPGFFGDPITHKCYNSGLNCSEGYFGNTVIHMCVLPVDCQTITEHYYADNDTKMCIQKCNTPYYGLNTTWSCVLRCDQPYYGENTTRICLVQSGCGQFLSFADDQLDLCVSVCSAAPIFTYAENQTYTCVIPANCPVNMYAQNSTQSCVFYCPHNSTWYTYADNYKTKRCLATCFDTYYGQISSGYGWCTDNCPGTNYFRNNRTQLCTYVCSSANTGLGLAGTFGDQTTDLCVTQCPNGWFAQSEINRTCVLVCQDGTWGNYVTRVCITNPVTECPSGTWADNFTNLCQSYCNANSSNSQVFYGYNVTRSCIASCPSPTFAYSVTRVCIDICPFTIATSPGLFGDPGTVPTRLCVPVCLTSGLYRDVANKRTCQSTCTFNSSYKTYRDPTTMTCLAQCPTYPQYLYAQGTTSATAVCASSCPAGQYKYDGNTSCLSTCPYLLDPTINKCVDICPFNSAANTVLYANLITKICVTSANCPANTYASDDSLTCVSSCPVNTYINGKHCDYFCPDGTYINNNNRSCVAAVNCPMGYYGNNQTRTCVSVCTNGTFADDGTKMCLTTCYGNNYGDYLTGKCATTCSSGLIKNSQTLTCVASCTTGLFYNPLSSSCQSTCPSPYYADSTSNLCVSKCSSNPLTFAANTPTRTCVTTCPASSQWFNLVSRTCVSTCPTATYKYPLNVSCVAFCPTPYYLQTDTCVLNCSSSSTYADDTTRTCVQTCPLGYYKDATTYKCVLNCPQYYYASDVSKSCVTTCTANTYADPQNFKCVAVCSTNPVVYYAQPNSLKCVQICPAAYNSFADPVSQKCVTTCPSTYYADNRERKCIQNCSNIYYADSLTNPPSCVAICSSLTYADPLTFKCSTSCSNNYYAYSGNNTCVQFCPYGFYADPSFMSCKTQCTSASYQYADSLTHTCSSSCSHQQFSHKPSSSFNGSCVRSCPNGYFSSPTTMSCVTKCPNGYFGQIYNNTCMSTCSEEKFADAVNNLCQSTCPSLNSMFGERFSRKCVTNCSAQGKTFLYADSSTRLCTQLCSGSQYADPNTLTCVGSTSCSSGLVSDPYYHRCVSRCYNQTYAYAGTCYATCPSSTLYADEASQSCVIATNCAVGLFADPTKGKCVQHCDIASNRYANSASRTCQTGCSSPLYADNVTRTCTSLCTSKPQMYGLNSSRLCVLNCPSSTYGDPSLNLCVIKCADGSYGDSLTWSCVKVCPLGYFGDNSTNKCVATCPSSPVYFGDFYTYTCVLHCSNSLYADSLANRECVQKCASPNFSQNSTMTCQSFCSTGYADPTTRQCIATCSHGYYGHNFVCHQFQCPAATPIVYADDASRLCVTQCPQGTYGEPNTRKCVPICPISYSEYADTTNRVCRTSCITGTYADYSLRQCVPTCSSIPALFSYSSGNLCLANCPNGLFADNSTRSCSTTCPTPTYADNSTYRCVSICPTNPWMFGENLTNTCVYGCSVSFDRYADNASRTCVINCPTGTFADPVSRTCKDTCPSGYFAVNSTKRCELNCPPGSFADLLTRICVAVCPIDPIYYGDEVSWTCMISCPTNSFGNPLTQRCVYDAVTVSTCPTDYYSQTNSNLCVQVCPMKYNLYADPTTKACVSSCPSSYLSDNSTMRCVMTCPSYPNYYANLNTQKCVLYCPTNTWADDSSRQCVTTCPNNSYAENNTGRCVSQCLNSPLTLRDQIGWQCVSQCPTGYYADYFNKLCVSSCPVEGDGYARNDTRQCVKVCPTNTYAYQPTRICVQTCYGNTFADSISRRCVSVCPRYPAMYADSTTMKCVSQCPSGLFAYDATRECVVNCPVNLGYYRQNYSRSCVTACQYTNNTFADNTTGYCVTQCSPGSFADPSTKKCVAVCPDQPLMYAQNTTLTCVATCPTNTFGQNKTRICVAACPSGSLSYPQNTLCVFECPIGYYAYIPTQFCMGTCPQPFYGDPSTRTCVQTCPINQLLYADNSTRTCVSVCPSGSYAYQWQIACLPSCPNATPPYVQTYAASYDNTCTEQCAFPFFSYDPTFSCVSQCPDPYYNKVETHTCEACPTSCTTCIGATSCNGCVLGYYLQNGLCVTSCTLIYYANPTTRKCVLSTGCAPYFGINSTHTCASSCPNGLYANTATYRCDLCPQTCVTCTSATNCPNCITASVSYNNFCYGYCNYTTNGTGMYYNTDNATCTTSCPEGSYASIVYCKLCASQCSACVDLSTKCTNCSSGKYIHNNGCVDQCPTQYKPVSSRACTYCGNSCGSGLTYRTNVTTINGQNSLFVNFDSAVDITGNLYNTFSVTTSSARLLQSSTPSYQIVVIDANTIQIIFPPGTSQSSYNFQITNPQNVIGPNGQLPATLTAQIAMDVSKQYSSSVSQAPSSFSTYFIFLSFICIVSFLFDLELMRFLQLLYTHYFVIMALPPHLFKVFEALRYSTFFYLPTMFKPDPAVLHPDVPDTVYNMVGDYNFLRNAGFAFTPLVIILGIWGIIKLLSVPEINRFKYARVWCRNTLEKWFKFAVLLEWVFLFITNTVFFAFLQLRDYNMYDTFAQVGLVFAHFFILFFVVIFILVAYRVISFHKEHPQMSENIKKASQIILQDGEVDQLVSTNIFLSEKKKIDLRDIYYPQVNNENIFPFRCVYKFSFLALLCPNVLYLRVIVLSIFIALAHSSVELQMGLCIPLNVLALLYFCKARPYSFKFKRYRIKNYIVIYHEVCLIIFEFLMLTLGIKESSGATAFEKEAFANYIIYYLTAVCTISFAYQIFAIAVFLYRKVWLRFIETELFMMNFPDLHAYYQAKKNKNKKLAKQIDPKAKEALKNMIKGYKKSKSALRPSDEDKANPQLPLKYKITYFDRSENSSINSKTTLSKRQKKQMLNEIFGKQDKQLPREEPEEYFDKLDDVEKETNGPEYEEYEEEIEIKAKDLAKYVANSDNLLKMKKAEADL